MKLVLTALLPILLTGLVIAQSLNMNLEANWFDSSLPNSGGLVYNDCWGYDAPNGTEVAIIGTLQRVYFFDVTVPSNPQIIDYFTILNSNGSTNSSIWRDMKTYDHYAYACADQGSSGLAIFDLQYVPDSVVLVDQNRDFFLRSHNIFIDVANARLYTAGANSNSEGTIVLDLASDPEAPTELGSPTFPLGYIHDIYVIDNVAYGSHGSDQALCIYDFTDPTAPVLMKTLDSYPEAGYNHSSWLDASGTKLVFADETHGKGLKLVNPTLASQQTTNYHVFRSHLIENNLNSIAHNPFIKDDLCYISYYHDGVQVFDISDTNNIVKVAYYDTYVNADYVGYEGCWGVYPFLQNGVIIASDISNGLFVLSMTGSVLPLEIIGFDATAKTRDVALTLKVTVPDDGEQFIVEHSRDGVDFETIAESLSRHEVLTYHFTHLNPGPGNHFYRIQVIHRDGSSNYTPVRLVQFDMDQVITVQPTVVDDILQVDTQVPGQISLMSMDGKRILDVKADELSRTELVLGGLPSGQYYVVLHTTDRDYATAITKQ